MKHRTRRAKSSGRPSKVRGFFLAVGFLSGIGLRTLDKLHVHGHFNLQHIDAVTIFREFAHALDYDVRFFLGVVETFFVRAFFVSDKLEEKWDVVGPAFVANALYPCVLFVIDVLGIEGRVVEQNLDAVRPSFFQSTGGPMIEQVTEAATCPESAR